MVNPNRHLTWKRGYRDARWTGKRLSIALSINIGKAWPVGRKTQFPGQPIILSLNFQPIRENIFSLALNIIMLINNAVEVIDYW